MRLPTGSVTRTMKTKQVCLDEEILAMCPTEETEEELTKADEISAKIEEALVEINHITREGPERTKSQITSNQESTSPGSSTHVSKEDFGNKSGSKIDPPSKADKRAVKSI